MQNPTNSHSQAQAVAIPLPATQSLSPDYMAALGYFCGIAAIVALVAEPFRNQRRSRFHAIQALCFQASWVVGYVLISMGTVLLSHVMRMIMANNPLGLAALLFAVPTLVLSVYGLTMFVTWIYLIAASVAGRDPELPLLGRWAFGIAESRR